MGALSLTNGALLGGLALLAAPLVAHLIQRRARRSIVFPSTMFLRECALQQTRLNRLKRLILLVLRLMAVACVVFAFTRPVWLDARAGAAERESAEAVVLLIDASLSVGQTDGGAELLERLKGHASRIIDQMRSGTDVANLVIADDRPAAVFPRLTPNLGALRAELERLATRPVRADFSSALAVAGRQLERHPGRRRLIILSDFQASNWSEIRPQAAALPSPVDVVLAGTEGEPPANVGLFGPECFPADPLSGQNVEVAVQLHLDAPQSRQVEVVMELDPDQSAAIRREQTLTLEPGETRAATFSCALPEGAEHSVRFTLPATDGLIADNTAYFVIGSRPAASVLVVSDDDSAEPGTAAFYLTRALAPFRDAEAGATPNRFEVRSIPSNRLAAEELRGVDVVFLGYLGALHESTAMELVKFVREGGGCCLFCGDGLADQNVALLDGASVQRMTPWTLVARRSPARSDPPLQIGAGHWRSQWFREFDERSQLSIREVAVRSAWTASAAAGDAEVLLMFSDGQPALGRRAFGAGQFLLANFSPESSSSDLGRRGPFVAMTQIAASRLKRARAQDGFTWVGQSIQFPRAVPDGTGWSVIGPQGRPVAATRTIDAAGDQIFVSRTESAGIYRLLDRGASTSVAVNIDPRESELRRVDVRAVEHVFQKSGAEVLAADGAALASAVDVRGRPLWGLCLALAMGTMACELLLLGVWKR